MKALRAVYPLGVARRALAVARSRPQRLALTVAALLATHFSLVYQSFVLGICWPIDARPVLSALYGPLIYALCTAWVFSAPPTRRHHLWLLGPASLVALVQVSGLGTLQTTLGTATRLLIYAYTFYWLIRALRLLFRKVSTGHTKLHWLYHAVILFTMLTTLGLVDLIQQIHAPGSNQGIIVPGLFVLGSAIAALVLFRRFLYPKAKRETHLKPEPHATHTTPPEPDTNPLTLTATTGKARDDALARRLTTLFADEKVFLKADLTLDSLAQLMGVKAYLVSRTINDHFRTSFPAFVRTYRVEHAKVLLRDTDHKMLAVALESGFSNTASFHRTFKRATGMTPHAYRSKAQARQ